MSAKFAMKKLQKAVPKGEIHIYRAYITVACHKPNEKSAELLKNMIDSEGNFWYYDLRIMAAMPMCKNVGIITHYHMRCDYTCLAYLYGYNKTHNITKESMYMIIDNVEVYKSRTTAIDFPLTDEIKAKARTYLKDLWVGKDAGYKNDPEFCKVVFMVKKEITT